MKHYSHSKLDKYNHCPRLFKIEAVDKRKAPDTPPLLIGSAVHAAIAAYDQHLTGCRLQTDITYRNLAMSAARDKMTQEGKQLDAEQWSQVAEVFDRFVESHILDPEAVVSIEKMERMNYCGMTWWGVMDLLQAKGDVAIITDYKSNWKVWTQAEAEKQMQTRIYAWMVNLLYGYTEFVARLDFVRNGVIREVELTMDDVRDAEKYVMDMIATIEADTEWKATPGNHCSWCAWSSECPAVSDLPTLVSSPEDAERLASEILVLEQQVKERKSSLSDWCIENGNVRVGGEVFGHLPPKDPESGWTINDIPVFIERLTIHGLDPWDFLSVNGTKLKSIRTAKKNAAVKADLEDIMERNVNTKFEHRKDDAA
jgi:CRISPR/Cas system-associated exonuclease Cas4 (RecB family)